MECAIIISSKNKFDEYGKATPELDESTEVKMDDPKKFRLFPLDNSNWLVVLSLLKEINKFQLYMVPKNDKVCRIK
jgi:hypothetical protein